ncbi:MAG: succinate dehydrogenase, cytochrome b556 subunit [bacterium]|nr:succinate dehydrogenase, cytochrome b556 subunit [bacterium]MDE0240057.1 succinate dehydrogenase, cytochrome b556 subunit [bacterium]
MSNAQSEGEASAARPLSPHLQVYRPQITSVLSITHRLTGILLSIGIAGLVAWLAAAAAGPDSFEVAREIAGSWPGLLILFIWSLCLVYHLLNGIRHLVWDTGRGLALKPVRVSGWAVVGGTVILTTLAWVLGAAVAG